MSIPIEAAIEPYQLLKAVRELGNQFRTSSDLPLLQRDEVEKAIIALRKVSLQIKWWHVTRENPISHHAFGFMAEQLEKYGHIRSIDVCCSSEQSWVKDLVKARIIAKQKPYNSSGEYFYDEVAI